MDTEEFNITLQKFVKAGLLVEVVRGGIGNQIMVTPKGHETWQVLNLFVSTDGANVIDPEPEPNKKSKKDDKPKKSTEEKMNNVIKTVVQVGAGISQLMAGLGSMAGDPVKMDMSQAGIDLGQGKNKPKTKRSYKKRKYTRTRR